MDEIIQSKLISQHFLFVYALGVRSDLFIVFEGDCEIRLHSYRQTTGGFEYVEIVINFETAINDIRIVVKLSFRVLII